MTTYPKSDDHPQSDRHPQTGGSPGAAGLELAEVSIRYGSRTVVDRLSFGVGAGESLALVGPSGAGKSSVLGAIMGTVKHTGTITVAGTVVARKTASELRRHSLGIVFQHGELLGELSPVENVALAAAISGTPLSEATPQARELLAGFGVPESDTTDTLSGGERQRVALARALIRRPHVVLADEPTGSLDTALRDQMLEALLTASKDSGAALVIVTHDAHVAASADRQVELPLHR